MHTNVKHIPKVGGLIDRSGGAKFRTIPDVASLNNIGQCPLQWKERKRMEERKGNPIVLF